MNGVVQAVMTQENELLNQDLSCHATGEADFTELFDQFAGWMSPSDWLEPDMVVINKVSLQGKSTIYQVIVQNIITSLSVDFSYCWINLVEAWYSLEQNIGL